MTNGPLDFSPGGTNTGNVDMAELIPMLMQALATTGGSLDQQGPAGAMGNMANQWIQNRSYMNMMKNQLGNTALQNMTLADTAGLNPALMSNIMKTNLEQRGLNQKDLSNAYDAAYKQGLLSNYQQQSRDRQATERRLSKPFIGGYTKGEFKSLPKEEQEYTIYKLSEGARGGKVMSRREYKQTEPTTKGRFIRDAMRNPEVKKIAKELAQVGGMKISIGERVEQATEISKAKAGLKGQNYFKDPSWTDDLNKFQSSEEVGGQKFMLSETDQPRFMEESAVRWIENKIRAGGGVRQDVKWLPDGRTMQWTVRWPSGDTETITHGIRN